VDERAAPLQLIVSLTQVIKKLLGVAPPAPPLPPARFALWSIGIFSGKSPLSLGPSNGIPNPAITRESVTDVPASFVADPFLIRVGDAYYLFFELLNRTSGRGEIGVAKSAGLTRWQYQRVVLAEPFHLSYPHVFEWEAAFYMVPESYQANAIRLYRANAFPGGWEHVHTLLEGQPFSDSTVFRHDGRWWLFTQVFNGKHDNLYLYSADDLFGAWTEHPASPIVDGDPHTARPAGRVIRLGENLIRFAQDCAPQYGLAVRAFEITKLSTTEYVERPVSDNAILAGSSTGWNASRMHHVDAQCVGHDQWVAAVDGARNTTMAEINGTA
jgi:hypothetical protein